MSSTPGTTIVSACEVVSVAIERSG
jgi:hypothetical protein